MKPCKHPCCPDKGPCRKPKKTTRRKPIRKVSIKQQSRLRKYSAQKKAQFNDDNICAVALIENKPNIVVKLFKDCQHFATQKHHPAGRLGDHLFDEGVKVCGNCHRVIEEHPALAVSLGLSTSRHTKN